MQKYIDIRRIIDAAGYSWSGLKAVFKSEAAFRQELALCAILVPLSLWIDVTKGQRAMMLASLFVLLIVELLNTAIETVINRISTEIHPLSKLAKDIGSAAVALSIGMVVMVWGVILLG